VAGVPVEEPLQLFPGLFEGEGALGKIAADLGGALMVVKDVQVGWHEVAEGEAGGFEDRHRDHPFGCPAWHAWEVDRIKLSTAVILYLTSSLVNRITW